MSKKNVKRIVMVGNPNVGKSVLFSRLTGVNVISSNYPGTTVGFAVGNLIVHDKKYELIDAPGTYTLDPTNKAEEVAVNLAKNADVIIDVVDATNLERNLNLTLQLLKFGKPVIVVLNLWDETKHTGIIIEIEKLEKMLGVPVITTCALTGEGVKDLISRMNEAKANTISFKEEERWNRVGEIIQHVQKIVHKHHRFSERIEDLTIKPLTGIPISILVLALTFFIVRIIGESIISYVFDPIFTYLWAPIVLKFSHIIGPGIVHNIFIGTLVNGQIDFVESLGLLTTGLYVPLAMVLPYVFSFYLMLSFLEDSGYLPRLAVLVDGLMHKVGLHGLSIIPMVLGLGCNVPAALSTRVLETKRERFIASTLMAIAVPCMAQIAMIIGLIGPYGAKGMGIVFLTLFLVWLGIGIILNKIMKGESPEIFLEIPPYRVPYWKAMFLKVWMRIRWFIYEAVPYVLIGVLIVNLLYTFGIIDFIGRLASPLVKGILGLPEKAVGALIIGFLRKDVAVGMLAPLGMSLKQLVIASVVLAMYFPCIATFTVMTKELGVKDMLKSTLIMIISSFTVGGLLNLIL